MHKAASAVTYVKSNASQWKAMLCDDVGFLTVYRKIYGRKILTLSIRLHVTYVSAIECKIEKYIYTDILQFISVKFYENVKKKKKKKNKVKVVKAL